jgi:hypothetical protein
MVQLVRTVEQLSAANTLQQQQQSELARMTQTVEQLSAANTSQKQQMVQLVRTVEQLSATSTSQQQQVTQLVRTVEQLSAANVSLRQQVESQQRDIAALQAESTRPRADVQRALAVLRAQVSVLAAGGEVFAPRADAPLDGIISYLTRKYGGNVHDEGVVETTASSDGGSDFGAKRAVEPVSGGCQFLSDNVKNSWLCFDFKDMRVLLTDYSVLSSSVGVSHPKQWCLEVSTDGTRWTEVDQRNNNDLKGGGLTATYKVSQQVKCRYIRMRSTGQSHDRDNILMLRRLEIFGTLYEN